MPIPLQRDAESTQRLLQQWLRNRSGDDHLSVDALHIPQNSGFSNETLIFETRGLQSRSMVARVYSAAARIYPGITFRDQYDMHVRLHRSGRVPVPRPYWYEADPELLGAPFYVMDRVDGEVPPDFPSYHRAGWFAELNPASRARLWYAAIRAMHRVHGVPPPPAPAGPAPDPVVQELARYESHLDFFAPDSPDLARRALDRLRLTRPAPGGSPSVQLWGDARIGNVVFSGTGVAALLDFEMGGVGPAEMDLAWFLYLDRHLSEGIGSPRLPGLPAAGESVAYYERLCGRPITGMPFYELLASFKFFLITARVTELAVEWGIVGSRSQLPLHDNAARLLGRTLDAG